MNNKRLVKQARLLLLRGNFEIQYEHKRKQQNL